MPTHASRGLGAGQQSPSGLSETLPNVAPYDYGKIRVPFNRMGPFGVDSFSRGETLLPVAETFAFGTSEVSLTPRNGDDEFAAYDIWSRGWVTHRLGEITASRRMSVKTLLEKGVKSSDQAEDSRTSDTLWWTRAEEFTRPDCMLL
ncbi:hypothetical protein EDB86DRAFT_2834248 [Lactarius hatsudake]|nr:hypothetical protein EDB86DRAFT_2834248 [Lactarius hatsudake]